MNELQLREICYKFREAIERVRDRKGFFSSDFNKDRMSKFPYDCCDDITDLLGFFLLDRYKLHTRRLTKIADSSKGWNEYHCVLILDDNETIIDLTGDQFNNDNRYSTYVGPEDEFYKRMNYYDTLENILFFDNNRLMYDYKAILDELGIKNVILHEIC